MDGEINNRPIELLEIGSLIEKHISEKLNIIEEKVLHEWIEQSKENKEIFELLINPEDLIKRLSQYHEISGIEAKCREKLVSKLFPAKTVLKRSSGLWRHVAAAAVVVVIITTATYFWLSQIKKQLMVNASSQTQRYKNDVAPGKYKAKLTLSDGLTVMLDNTTSGELEKQGKTVIVNKDGQLVYKDPAASNTEVLYNTLTTAKSESYATTLSDGTKIWLNAGSSVTYPVVFADNERKVTFRGEAYFEVAKNVAKPFKATIMSQSGETKGEVEVLGTHFNIMAYDDETTVRNQSVILKPGQQSIFGGKEIKVINDVNMDKITAWTNQDFHFSEDDIKTIMRQLARWYDVEVVYEGNIPSRTFYGLISRNKKLTEVLNVLEGMDIHFRIEERKITVKSD
jgi:transmembrane sensor